MAASVRINRKALVDLVNGPDGVRTLTDHGVKIRDRARANARAISPRLASALWVEAGQDGEGAYVDVGYNKKKPGWVLWFAEVGTFKQPARPHLRPAVRPSSD